MNLEEKTISKKTIFEGRIINVRVDDIELPDGKKSIREVVEHSGGVCVAPLTDDGKLIFVRQYRYPYSQTLLELPAGKLEKGEEPLEAGKRELQEETGASAKRIFSLGKVYPTVAYCTEIIHLYCAVGLSFSKQKLDDGEFLELETLSLDEAVSLVMDDSIRDSKTQIAVLKIAELARSGKLPEVE